MSHTTTYNGAEPPPLETEGFADYARRVGLRGESVRSYQLWVARLQKSRGNSAGLDEKEFLDGYVSERKLSISSIIQGRAALDLYCHFSRRSPPKWDNIVREKSSGVRQACTRQEVVRLLASLDARSRIVASLLYGAGLQISETVSIRIGHLDLERSSLFVENAEGGHNRFVPLPTSTIPDLRSLIAEAKAKWRIHSLDPNWEGVAPAGVRGEDDFWLFPGRVNRGQPHPHVHKATIQHCIKRAVGKLGLHSGVSCRSLRHSFAAHHLDLGTDIRAIQELLGHRDLSTTLIYTHVSQPRPLAAPSPLDSLNLGSAVTAKV